VHVLHGIESPSLLYQPATREFAQQLATIVKTEMAKRLSRSEKEGVAITVAIERGATYSETIDYPASRNVDMILLGTEGKGPISRAILRSVADKVVRKASCPVLTIRASK